MKACPSSWTWVRNCARRLAGSSPLIASWNAAKPCLWNAPPASNMMPRTPSSTYEVASSCHTCHRGASRRRLKWLTMALCSSASLHLSSGPAASVGMTLGVPAIWISIPASAYAAGTVRTRAGLEGGCGRDPVSYETNGTVPATESCSSWTLRKCGETNEHR